MKRVSYTRKILSLSLFVILTAGSLFATGQSESEAKDEKKTLDIFAFAGPIKEEFWLEAVKEFNSRFPDVEVNLTAGPKINDQVRINIAAGNAPDIYFSAGAGKITIPQLVAEDLIIPLDDFLVSKTWNGTDSFQDSLISGRVQKIEGKTYGIEVPFHLVGFFYHEPTFKEKGWEIPSDFRDFQKLAPQIAADGMSPMVTTGVYPYYFEHFVLRGGVAAAGGAQALLDWANLKPGFFTTDAFKSVIEKYEWTIKNGYLLKDSAGLNHTASQTEWIHGKAAFVTSGTWIESEMKNDFPEGYAAGIRFMPSFFIDNSKDMTVTPYGAAPVSILRGDGEEEAKEFLRALYSPSVMKRLTEITNILSNVPEANTISQKSPAITSAVDWYENTKSVSWPVGGYATQDITKALQGNLQSLMMGDLSSDEFCNNMEAAAEKVRSDDSIIYYDAYIPE
jgi:N-acetylglucosamine transport system substrate-binding protein